MIIDTNDSQPFSLELQNHQGSIHNAVTRESDNVKFLQANYVCKIRRIHASSIIALYIGDNCGYYYELVSIEAAVNITNMTLIGNHVAYISFDRIADSKGIHNTKLVVVGAPSPAVIEYYNKNIAGTLYAVLPTFPKELTNLIADYVKNSIQIHQALFSPAHKHMQVRQIANQPITAAAEKTEVSCVPLPNRQ